MKIEAVYVKKGELLYSCQPFPAGFKCGKCQRGTLGPAPKKRDKCRVCKAVVAQVVTDKDFVFDSRLRPINF